MKFVNLLAILAFLLPQAVESQRLIPVAEAWSNNSVNATVFRKNSIVSHGDTQFVAYYDNDGFMTLAKRKLGETQWQINKTQYKGNVKDAHNGINIMTDGDGYLHVSWDHHGHPLRYAKGIAPLSLQLGDKESMTGKKEGKVTYPEFYRMPNGDLIFIYRDGQSGQGNLALNRYDLKTKTWQQLHENLIGGQGQRNAYWQACLDGKGVLHLSWVWRETGDVATNHDMCYARSTDGGKTWENTKGVKYDLPVTAETAEYACIIPQNSDLINQTSMTADKAGNPYIATYWKEKDSTVPQYHIVYHDGKKWQTSNLNFRTLPFSISGYGTKRTPISRPQVVAKIKGKKVTLGLLFRDEERSEKVSIAICNNIKKNNWQIKDLTDFPVGSWEPSFDTELWKNQGLLHVYVQHVNQADSEGITNTDPQMVQVLEFEGF
ncbi:alpha-l-rhamnosidase [Viscerimonas tarda]